VLIIDIAHLKVMVISNPILLFAWLCLQSAVHSAITGRVTPSNSMV
jgi:hypothetical protein